MIGPVATAPAALHMAHAALSRGRATRAAIGGTPGALSACRRYRHQARGRPFATPPPRAAMRAGGLPRSPF